MKQYKYRHELKFKISRSAAEVLKQKLSLILNKDKYGYYIFQMWEFMEIFGSHLHMGN